MSPVESKGGENGTCRHDTDFGCFKNIFALPKRDETRNYFARCMSNLTCVSGCAQAYSCCGMCSRLRKLIPRFARVSIGKQERGVCDVTSKLSFVGAVVPSATLTTNTTIITGSLQSMRDYTSECIG